MEAKIQKQIVDYFSFFEEFNNTAKTCMKDCQNCAVAINKFIVRCRKITEADTAGTPLEDFVGLQSKLSASLHNLISEDIRDIRSNLSKIEELFEKLCSKHRVFTESSLQVDVTQEISLVKGTPFQPQLKILVEFAEDTLTFGSEVIAQIETSLSVLTQKQFDTDSLVDNFKVLGHWQNRIPEILTYTSYCSENQV